MHPEPLRRLRVERLRLPTLPTVVQHVQALVADEGAGTREIAAVVAEDAPLATRVLRIANSAFYGLRERCLSTEQACTVLGLRTLQAVVLQAGVLQQYEHLRRHPGFDLDELWRHSILTAQIASLLARRCRAPLPLRPEEAYTCGLLHDIGQLVMLDELGEQYLDVIGAARLMQLPFFQLERRMLGIDHTEVGAMVAERWQLPVEAHAAIRYHHGPRERVHSEALIALVANANLVASRVQAGDEEAALATFDPSTLGLLGVSASEAAEVVELAFAAWPRVEL